MTTSVTASSSSVINVPAVDTLPVNAKTATAKLLIDADGTVRLKADPNNFPTPGMKDNHKLFASCNKNGQMNVYYSPTGNPSQVYLLKPTETPNGCAVKTSQSQLSDLIIRRQNQLDNPTSSNIKIVSGSESFQATKEKQVSLLKPLNVNPEKQNMSIGKTAEHQASEGSGLGRIQSISPSTLLSKSQAFNLVKPVIQNEAVPYHTFPKENGTGKDSLPSSNSSSRTATPDPAEASATLPDMDIGGTIAAFLADTEGKKTSGNPDQSLSNQTSSSQALPVHMPLILQRNQTVLGNLQQTDNTRQQSIEPYYTRIANSNTQILRYPVIARTVGPLVPPMPTGTRSIQSLTYNTNKTLLPTAAANAPRLSSAVTKPTAVLVGKDIPETNVKPMENETLNIRIDSVFSLADTSNKEELVKPCIAVSQPIHDRTSKNKTTVKIMSLKTVHCKPCYVVLERMLPQTPKKKKKRRTKIQKPWQMECSDYCRKRTLRCLCEHGLLDCKHPDQNRKVTYFDTSLIEVDQPKDGTVPTTNEKRELHMAVNKEPKCKQNNGNCPPVVQIKKTSDIVITPSYDALNSRVNPNVNVKKTTTGQVLLPDQTKPNSGQNLTIILPTTSTSLLKSYYNTPASTAHAVIPAPSQIVNSTQHSVCTPGNNIRFVPFTQPYKPPVNLTPIPSVGTRFNIPNVPNLPIMQPNAVASATKTNQSTANQAVSPQNNKYFLVTHEGKTYLIPTMGTGNASENAFMLNPSKDGTSKLLPTKVTYNKQTCSQQTNMTPTLTTTNPQGANTTVVSSTASRSATSICSQSHPSGLVVMSNNKAPPVINQTIREQVTSASTILKSYLTAKGPPSVTVNSAIPSATTVVSTDKRPYDNTVDKEPVIKKRKKTLAERYPLPPGVVIKREPVTKGYGDEDPVLPVSSSLSTAPVDVSSAILKMLQSTKRFVPSKVSGTIPSTTNSQITHNGNVTYVSTSTASTSSQIRLLPSTNHTSTVVLSQTSNAFTTAPPAKTRTVIPSIFNPPTICSSAPFIIRTVPPPVLQSTSSSSFTPLAEPIVTFPTRGLQSPAALLEPVVIFGDETDEVIDPPSPGPPDLGEPQITLPMRETSNYSSPSTDELSAKNKSSLKTVAEKRIEKLRQMLKERETALDELRRNRAAEESISFDDD